MVEVNSTFYSVPDLRTVERWCAATPSDFIFDVKLHQLFSFHSTNRCSDSCGPTQKEKSR